MFCTSACLSLRFGRGVDYSHHRLIKIAKKNEMHTQIEVAALLHNMSCHWSLVDILRRRKVDRAVWAFNSSTFPEVVEWSQVIEHNMIQATWTGAELEDDCTDAKVERLQSMKPLKRAVTWTTWGSKLDNIFTPILYSLPSLKLLQISTPQGTEVEIDLSRSHSRRKVKHISTWLLFAAGCWLADGLVC